MHVFVCTCTCSASITGRKVLKVEKSSVCFRLPSCVRDSSSAECLHKHDCAQRGMFFVTSVGLLQSAIRSLGSLSCAQIALQPAFQPMKSDLPRKPHRIIDTFCARKVRVSDSHKERLACNQLWDCSEVCPAHTPHCEQPWHAQGSIARRRACSPHDSCCPRTFFEKGAGSALRGSCNAKSTGLGASKDQSGAYYCPDNQA